jgi:N6-L-threonylcarbamoyladenine synthase
VKNPRHKDFTYSGLKTAVLNYVQKAKRAGTLDVKQICASFQREAVGQLVTKSIEKMRELGIKKLCVCGGVSANTHLREQLALAVEKIGAVVHFPHMEFCTDNAAMVAAAAILGVKMHQSSQTC